MADTKKYLDQQGLSTFWEKVKAKAKSEAAAAQTAAEAKAAEVANDLATNYYNKTDTDSKITAVEDKITALGSVMNYKGTKATTADLPTTGNKTGDVWHITADSGEYAWDGTEWQELGSTIDLSNYATLDDVTLKGVKVNGTELTITDKKVNVTIEEGGTNGTLKVNGTDVKVHGLGTAAYTESTAYATAEQGAKADTALQDADLVAITTEYINALS